MEIFWKLFMLCGFTGVFCLILAASDAIMDGLCRAFPRLDAWIDGLSDKGDF